MRTHNVKLPLRSPLLMLVLMLLLLLLLLMTMMAMAMINGAKLIHPKINRQNSNEQHNEKYLARLCVCARLRAFVSTQCT